MKNGKVIERLQSDRRVRTISVTDKSAAIFLADGFYAKDAAGNGIRTKMVGSAREAEAFIKSALPMPVAREGYKIVTNLMSGLPVEERIGTPWGCSVQSETYWCS
jgi:hypothetical protein